MKIEAQATIPGWTSYRVYTSACIGIPSSCVPWAGTSVPRAVIHPETVLTPIKTPTENLLWWVQPAFMLWLLGFSCALYWAWHQ